MSSTGGNQRARRRYHRNNQRGNSNVEEIDSPNMKAPTVGAETVIFRLPSKAGGKEAADCEDGMKKLAELIPMNTLYKSGGPEMGQALYTLTKPVEVRPTKPANDKDAFEIKKYELECEEELNRQRYFEENNKKVYSMLWLHCTPMFRSRLKNMDEFADVERAMDGIELAKLIKKISYSIEGKAPEENSMVGAAESMVSLHTCMQAPGESNTDFVQRLKSSVEVAKSIGMMVGLHTKADFLFQKLAVEKGFDDAALLDPANKYQVESLRVKAVQAVQAEYLAALAIVLADKKRYYSLRVYIKKKEALGDKDVWPKAKDLPAAQVLLDEWSRLNPVREKSHPSPQATTPKSESKDEGEVDPQGMAFMQQKSDGPRVNSKGEFHCHECGAEDHWKKDCPQRKEKRKNGVSGMQQLSSVVESCEDSDGEEWVDEGCNHHQQSSKSQSAEETSAPKAYFDSCTAATTIDETYLEGKQKAEMSLHVKCNAGVMVLDRTGFLGDLKAWARRPDEGIANLLSIPELEIFLKENGGRLTYDSDGDWVLTMNGETHIIEREQTGPCKGMPFITLAQARSIFKISSPPPLLAADVAGAFAHQDVPTVATVGTSTVPEEKRVTWAVEDTDASNDGGCFIQETVRGNVEGFSKRQVEGAKRARELQVMIGNPPDRKFRELVRDRRLLNCNVTLEDVTNALAIYGRSRAVLRRSSTRQTPKHVKTGHDIEIPRDFFKLHRFVTLAADVMFVNGLPFLTSVSQDIGFLTAEFLPVRTLSQLSNSLTKVLQLYGRGGFIVRVVMVDNEFAPLADHLPIVEIDATAAGEHVVLIERMHRHMKDRARGILAELHYSYYPTQLIIHLIYHVILWINATTFKLGNYSAREFVTGRSIDLALHCQVPFGSYIEPSEDPQITNTMDWRTEPSIALGSTGNIRGTQKVLCLLTNKVRRRRNIANKMLPCPDSIIRMVNKLGIKNKREDYGRTLQFRDRCKREYAWDDNDLHEDEGGPTEDIYTSHLEMAAELPGVTWASDVAHLVTNDNVDDVADEEEAMSTPFDTAGMADGFAGVDEDVPDRWDDEDVNDDLADADLDGLDDPVPDNWEDDEIAGVHSLGSTGVPDVEHDDPAGVTVTMSSDISDTEHDSQHDATPPRYPSRVRTPTTSYEPTMTGKSYPTTTAYATQSHFQETTVQQPLSTDEDVIEYMTGFIMMQQHYYSKGLKLFGEKGSDAVQKELQQMHDMKAYAPLDASTLDEKQKKDAVNQLMFLTQKRCGKIKARSCADGRKQREYISKEDASSPTVSLESIFLTMCIEAHEGREVATMDIPGAFLHTDIDEDVVMQLKGKLAELMVQVDPKMYRKYIVMENGQKVLYVKAQKAVYGLLRSSLLFYLKLRGDLERLGFEFNPYDPCTANKMINDKQMTVVFHVDDLKVPHVDSSQIDWFADEMRKIYGDKLAVNKGKIHDYLGMMIDYSIKGKVQVSMIEFVKKTIDAFPEELTSTSATPAADHLFRVREDSETRYLEEERADAFHSVTAMLLFLCCRARRDIQTAVSFLTTRVKKPDEDDWGKLKRVLKYLKGTMYMKLTLEVDKMGVLKWWIDSSHNVHEDCRGHTGTMLSLGKGAALSGSTKQKLNTRSSTETELVGTHDGLPQVLWCRHFVEAQGYTIEHNILHQDNQSTILMLRNGRASSTKRTKHIHARYFFIKDKIDKEEVEIQYCPTEQMWADVNTKPLQGKPYRVMHSHLMNVPEDYDDEIERLRTCQALGGPKPND